MKIAIDLQACQTPDSGQRGIGRYSLELAKAIVRNRGPHQVHVLLNQVYSNGERLREELALAGEHSLETYRLLPLADVKGEQRRNRQLVNDRILNWRYARAQPDVLHISSVFEGFTHGDAHVTARVTGIPAKVRSATLYDVIPLLFADKYLSDDVRPLYFERLAIFPKLDLILSLSESARQDAIRHLDIPSESVTTIGAAVSPVFRRLQNVDPTDAGAAWARHGIGGRFILYTGGIDYRKNFDFLLHAYAALPQDVRSGVQLVMVCAITPGQKTQLLRRAAALGVEDRLVLPGYVSDEELNLLYNTCELFVFPSLYEGFGLPVLEAMSCGACVLASDVSSMPEILDMPDLLFDPNDAPALTQLMLDLLLAPDRRRAIGDANLIRSRQFSWDRVGSTPRSPQWRRRSLARLGVATYNRLGCGDQFRAALGSERANGLTARQRPGAHLSKKRRPPSERRSPSFDQPSGRPVCT